MNGKTRSLLTFIILLLILAAATALNVTLPQGDIGEQMPEMSMPLWQMALASAAVVLVVYGLLGFLGWVLWRRMNFPDIWEETVTNRQRFLIPALVGCALGVGLVLADLAFSPFNGVGRFIHPPFPTSIVASIAAGIGEEIIFRLFFIAFWTWFIGRVIRRGRPLEGIYRVVSVFSAFAFAAGHLPSLIYLLGVTDPMQLPPVLLVEIFLLNGAIALFAAYYFKKFGFLAPVGIHFWADVVWHVLWGVF